jgi:hypothetical protein
VPEHHYKIGGQMARYSVKGAMRVYDVVGEWGPHLVSPHREGFGSIEAIGSLTISPEEAGSGETDGRGQVVVSHSAGKAQDGFSDGIASMEASGTAAHSGVAVLDTVSDLAADIEGIDGKSVQIVGAGSPAASGTTTRNVTGVATGAGVAEASATSKLTILQMLQQLGMTTDLVTCLDIGDGNSFTNGQTITDVSGNGSHFCRGASTGTEGNDPTPAGSVDGRSANEYLEYDGGDYCSLTGTNSFTDFHKNNAIYTVAGIDYIPASNGQVPLFTTGEAISPSTDLQMQITFVRAGASSTLNWAVRRGWLANAASRTHIVSGAYSGLLFWAVCYDEAASDYSSHHNGDIDTASVAYSSPSSTNPSGTPRIGRYAQSTVGSVSTIDAMSGSRFLRRMVWRRRVSDTDMQAFRTLAQSHIAGLP